MTEKCMDYATQIVPIVDKLIEASRGDWTQSVHCSLIAAIAKAAKQNDSVSFLAATLNQHGIGGNCSQFTQFLRSTKGGCKLAAKVDRIEKYLDVSSD
jgi:hypothetical protein